MTLPTRTSSRIHVSIEHILGISAGAASLMMEGICNGRREGGELGAGF
jgi:hypothetical protein